ncbi:diaminopimelate epimerase [Permianibacter sp. IMCC34836]|uniref:diaminopimelate epimerase n=1 Tax=Permianibacter fluminis TaxID=2738515 RepID=UPI001B7D8A3A|nr:diaminopimelate epimerase [Permianibacter fluminis]NQD36248.1 diaminopimelate epimerase [Permianibacter fluminis]
MLLNFAKMQALGNDFMIVDGISQPVAFSPTAIQRLADRKRGVGFDQLLLVEPPYSPEVDFHYRIFNADGSEVGQCGNGARCFARFVRHLGLTWKNRIRVSTIAGEMNMQIEEEGLVTVDIAVPTFEPEQIPMQFVGPGPQHKMLLDGVETSFTALSVGNPHAVLDVRDVALAAVAEIGQAICESPVFPQQTNVGFLQIIDRATVRLRVYERGVGETEACGSGACAAVVAGRQRGLLDEQVQVQLPGGTLTVRWPGEGQPVQLTGPAVLVYEGQIEL